MPTKKENLIQKFKSFNNVAAQAGRVTPKNPMTFSEKVKKIIASKLSLLSDWINSVIEAISDLNQRLSMIEQAFEDEFADTEEIISPEVEGVSSAVEEIPPEEPTADPLENPL